MTDNSGYIVQVELTGFADALDDKYSKKRGIKDNTEVFGINNWVNRGDINSNEEHEKRKGASCVHMSMEKQWNSRILF